MLRPYSLGNPYLDRRKAVSSGVSSPRGAEQARQRITAHQKPAGVRRLIGVGRPAERRALCALGPGCRRYTEKATCLPDCESSVAGTALIPSLWTTAATSSAVEKLTTISSVSPAGRSNSTLGAGSASTRG